ncbi:unnamed protein product [Lactuca saligna]|uniref:Pentacotripeptide-repeat region of PRORP domain-containing protein n=1 Tax=Lactuca saligna TaxID=75948 RepID=A0AA35YVY6_LACSI|nr:unnamed protein product [Lactuca saligna]
MNNVRLLLRRGYATKYSGRVITEMDNGRSFAVEVQVPNIQQLDPRGYPLPRRDLVCKIVNILQSRSSDPFIELSDYLETLTLTLTASEAAEILKSLHSTSLALQFFRFCPSSIPKFRHDCFTYNRILLILSKSSSPDRFDSVRRIIDEMERSRVHGNISTVNLLIGIFGGGEDLDRCLRLVKKWELRMNRYTYKCLLQAHLRSRDSNKGLEVYQEMKRKGYQPDIFAYNMLLDALAKDEKVDQANKVFEDMKKKHCEPDEYTYTILIRMTGKHGKLDDAISLFQEMLSKNLAPNLIAYNTTIQLQKDNLIPLCTTLCSLLLGNQNSFGRAGRVDEAIKIFDELENSNCKPDIISYNSLINCLGKNGDVDEAYMRCKEMEEKGLNPDVVTYSTLIECFGKSDKVEMACRLFDEMLSEGCCPNIVTYNILLDCLERSGRTAEAVDLYAKIKEQGGKIQLLDGFCFLHWKKNSGSFSSICLKYDCHMGASTNSLATTIRKTNSSTQNSGDSMAITDEHTLLLI